MKKSSERLIYFWGLLLVVCLISATFYLQEYDGFVPCPLCILQRITFGILGVLFLLGVLFAYRRITCFFINLLAASFSLLGILLSGRQVWLQHLSPNQNSDCGVSLQYLIKALPFDQVIAKIIEGGTECSQTGWEFLHLSLAEWSLFCFILFFGFSLWQIKRSFQKK